VLDGNEPAIRLYLEGVRMSNAVVVIGAGINGLTAAALLAKAGRDVLVLERGAEVGGAIRTAEVTAPGYRHDLYAMSLSAFAHGLAHAALADELAAQGLEFADSDVSACSVFPDGTAVGLFSDRDRTSAEIGRRWPGDRESFDELSRFCDRSVASIGALLAREFPSLAFGCAGVRAALHLGWGDTIRLARLVRQSIRDFTAQHFESRELAATFAAWSMHLDYGPDVAGGALVSFVETFASPQFGMKIAVGGAGRVPDALSRVITSLGGEIRTGVGVRRIVTLDRRVTGVETDNGTVIGADTVIANVNVRHLATMIVPVGAVSARARRQAESFRPGPSTVMVHYALTGPIPWRADVARRANYVHIGPYIEDMAVACADAAEGRIPHSPTLVVGQPSLSDPTRAPADGQVLWVQVRMMPSHISAAGEIADRDWSTVKEQVADRVEAIIEEYAPGAGAVMAHRYVESPEDLERQNPNLIDGDQLSGSHHLDQFFFRPGTAWLRHRSPVRGLFHVGAGTWPGAGSAGASGQLVADRLTARR
jgi:phytoene dehydrogenase-like protein